MTETEIKIALMSAAMFAFGLSIGYIVGNLSAIDTMLDAMQSTPRPAMRVVAVTRDNLDEETIN